MKLVLLFCIVFFSTISYGFSQMSGCPPNDSLNQWTLNPDNPSLIIPEVGTLAAGASRFRYLPNGTTEIWVDPTALTNSSKMSDNTVMALLSLLVGSQIAMEFPNDCGDPANINVIRTVTFVHSSPYSVTTYCHMVLKANDSIFVTPFRFQLI